MDNLQTTVAGQPAGRVLLSCRDHVAEVTLSHPGKFNAMSRAMWRELRTVFLNLAQRDDLRCILIRGEGGHFCAGGDIAEYASFRFDEPSLRLFHEEEVWGGLSAMLDCDIPLVACIEGNCMGAGVEISACCDVRVAGHTAKFGAPIARLGFPMAPREAKLVVGALGMLTAREMLLEAAVLDAADMASRGFVNQVVLDAKVFDVAQARVARMAALAPQAARLNKRTLRALANQSLPESVLDSAYVYAPSSEHREGIAAFLEKRQPGF